MDSKKKAMELERKKPLSLVENMLKPESNLIPMKLQNKFKHWEEEISDIEEWMLILTAAAANQEAPKRFPMTPADVSRSRKKARVETILESVEDDGVELLPAEPIPPVRRGSRAAMKLASMNLKVPNLNTKLRRPSHFGSQAGDMNNTNVSEAPPPKRRRKGTSNAPKADASSATVESSFASARDSVTSQYSKKMKEDTELNDEQMETDDDKVLSEKIEIRQFSTFIGDAESQLSKKSSLRVRTTTVTRTSKRVTKQLIKTIESPARRMTTRNASSKPHTPDMFSDTDDDTPLIRLVSRMSKLKRSDVNLLKEHTVGTPEAANPKEGMGFITINGVVPVVRLESLGSLLRLSADKHCKIADLLVPNSKIKEEPLTPNVVPIGKEAENLKSTSATGNVIPRQSMICVTATAEDKSPMDTTIAQESADKKLKISKPKALNNATNRNNATPEAIKNGFNRNFEPVSVKKRVEALEQKLTVAPAVPAKPEISVRVTRTKAKAMMENRVSELMALPEKNAQKMDTFQLHKLARKSLLRATKISIAKERKELDATKSVGKENSSPPRNATKRFSTRSVCPTSTATRNRITPHPFIHPSRLAVMSTSKQTLNNINTNVSTFISKTKVVSAAEEAEEKRKEERRYRRENKDDALLKKRAMIDDKIEQQRKKREEKAKNVLNQRALLEREKAEMLTRVEKDNEEKARLIQEREENLKREMIRKREEAKQKAAKIEERRVKQEAERLQALKLQEEEQQRLQAQKKKEQEDAERLHAKRMLEEKEKKEREAALKLEKLKQAAKKVMPPPVLDSTFVVEKPVARPPLIEASEYDYPLPDLSKGNDSDFSDGEEENIPAWAAPGVLVKSLKQFSLIPLDPLRLFFGSKPTTLDLSKIFPNKRLKHARSSSAVWRTPPRCSMLPEQV